MGFQQLQDLQELLFGAVDGVGIGLWVGQDLFVGVRRRARSIPKILCVRCVMALLRKDG
jgi:hypothetical protein